MRIKQEPRSFILNRNICEDPLDYCMSCWHLANYECNSTYLHLITIAIAIETVWLNFIIGDISWIQCGFPAILVFYRKSIKSIDARNHYGNHSNSLQSLSSIALLYNTFKMLRMNLFQYSVISVLSLRKDNVVSIRMQNANEKEKEEENKEKTNVSRFSFFIAIQLFSIAPIIDSSTHQLNVFIAIDSKMHMSNKFTHVDGWSTDFGLCRCFCIFCFLWSSVKRQWHSFALRKMVFTSLTHNHTHI